MPTSEPVRIRFLVCEDSIDQVVDFRVREKAEAMAEVLADPNLVTMALPDEDEPGMNVDDEDLEAVFAHLAGA